MRSAWAATKRPEQSGEVEEGRPAPPPFSFDKTLQVHTVINSTYLERRSIMSVYNEVTQAIIAELEKGVPPWVKSWSSHLPMNFLSQKEYRGTNVLLLWSAAQGRYASPYWLTYPQVENLGGYVRKGERATQIVYAATGRRVVVGPDDEQIEEEYRFLKWYWVFNAEQTEGISYEKPETKRPSQIIEEAEAFLSGIGANVNTGGNRALYRPFADTIYLPHPRDFHSMADYYVTNIHEHVHWTAHETRLNRPLVNRFGTEEYAFEELVAELGAAFLCFHLQIPSRLREDHAAYIGSWIAGQTGDIQCFIISCKSSGLFERASGGVCVI
jgi:antirestriction protein ArdC